MIKKKTSNQFYKHFQHFSNHFQDLYNHLYIHEDLEEIKIRYEIFNGIFTWTKGTFFITSCGWNYMWTMINGWTFCCIRSFINFIGSKKIREYDRITIRNSSYSSVNFLFPFSFNCSFGGLISFSSISRDKKMNSSCWERYWLIDCFDWRANCERSFCNRGNVD